MRNFLKNINILLFSILLSSACLVHAMDVDNEIKDPSNVTPTIMQNFTRQRNNALTFSDFHRMPQTPRERVESQESGYNSIHFTTFPECQAYQEYPQENNDKSQENSFLAIEDNQRPSSQLEIMINEQTMLKIKPKKRKVHNNNNESDSDNSEDSEFSDNEYNEEFDTNPKRFQDIIQKHN